MLDNKFKNLAKEMAKYINEDKPKTSSYDTQAVVRRIEGNTAYVHIPGGIDETPVSKTIAAQKGDIVQVRVSGKKAFLVGNASAPPTDDTKANIAQSTATTANAKAIVAEENAEVAKQDASVAKRIANVIRQHFWTDDNGAHVTQTTKEEYEQDPDNAGSNMLADSTAMHFRDGQTDVARFGANGAQIGLDEEAHSTVEKDRMEVYLDSQEPYFHVGLLKEPTDIYYQSSNKVLGSAIRKNPKGGVPGYVGQWYTAWAYRATLQECPINVVINIDYTGTAPTQNIYYIDWYIEQNKDEDLYGTADVIDSFGDKLGWSTRAKCVSAVQSFLQTYEYPADAYEYLSSLPYGAGYGQETMDDGTATYTYWTYNKENGHDFNADYDVQAGILYFNGSSSKYFELMVGGHVEVGANSFLLSYRCKSLTINYRLKTNEIISSFFAGSGIIPTNRDQFIIGKYNARSTDDVAFVIGNGKDDSSRSNSFEVSRDGTIRTSGGFVGGNIVGAEIDGTVITGTNIRSSGNVSDGNGKVLANAVTEDSNGDVAITRNITAGGKLTIGAINFNQLIQYTNVSATTASVSGNASGEATSAVSTLTNYYPIAITNVRVNTGAASLRRFYFATQQSGRASVTFGAQNDGSSAKTITCQADILWIKTTA